MDRLGAVHEDVAHRLLPGRTLVRVTGTAHAKFDSNFYDAESGEKYSISGLKRDRTDGRYGHQKPVVEEEARAAYDAFLAGSALPGRETG